MAIQVLVRLQNLVPTASSLQEAFRSLEAISRTAYVLREAGDDQISLKTNATWVEELHAKSHFALTVLVFQTSQFNVITKIERPNSGEPLHLTHSLIIKKS